MQADEYAALDAVGLADLLERKEVSPKELIELAFQRLDQVNEKINAVAYTRKEKALQEAENVDPTTAFKGVPMALKDSSHTIKGEPNTSGAHILKDNIALHTANFVQKLYDAGLISIGNSTTPEFAIKNITEPKLYGPARNPWNTDYSPGGSSGGAAALVAAGVVPVAGASDGGGSIRIPASFSGLVGLKPTRGRTSVGPGSGRKWHGAAIDFVLAKTVRDVARCLDNLQVLQPEAAFQVPLYEFSYEEMMLDHPKKGMRIGFTTTSPVGTRVSEDAKEAVLKTVKFLEKAGFHIEEVDHPVDGVQLMREYYLMNSGEMSSLIRLLEKQLKRNITAEDVEVETWLLYRAGQNVSAADFTESIASWDLAAEKMARFHETYHFFITPATAFPAPKIGQFTPSEEKAQYLREEIERLDGKAQLDFIYDMFLPSLEYTPFTQLANLTGQPAISVPVHMTKDGLPLGVQIMAPKGDEHHLIRLAHFLEQSDLWEGLKGRVLEIH